MPVISDELFQQVASIVGNKNIKPQRTSTFAERARLYGLYKRATVGKLLGPYDDEDKETDRRPITRPGILSIEGRSKYDAWLETQSMTMEEAREEYVKLALDLVGTPIQEAIEKG